MNLVRPLLLLVIFSLAVPSCICFQPAHRNDPQCAILNQVVDCTEDAVQALLPQFKPMVKQLIAEATGEGGKIDWTQVEKGLGSLGVKDGGCILADVEKDYLNTPSGLAAERPELAAMKASYKDNFETYRARKWPGVKFRVIKADGSRMTL